MSRPLVENWTSDREAAELARLAAGKIVLEVGTFKGFGAILMAQAGARMVHAVDWHRGDGDLGPRDTLCAWWTNVRRHHVEDQVVGHVGRSVDVLPTFEPQSFDFAFVDADHQYEAVVRDLHLVIPLVRPAGVIACHDYSSVWPGVVQAVDELVAHPEYALLRVVDSLAVVQLTESL
jgi:predicted O-methyltransferase YrrM